MNCIINTITHVINQCGIPNLRIVDWKPFNIGEKFIYGYIDDGTLTILYFVDKILKLIGS